MFVKRKKLQSKCKREGDFRISAREFLFYLLSLLTLRYTCVQIIHTVKRMYIVIDRHSAHCEEKLYCFRAEKSHHDKKKLDYFHVYMCVCLSFIVDLWSLAYRICVEIKIKALKIYF